MAVRLFLLAGLTILSGCVTARPPPSDPYEGWSDFDIYCDQEGEDAGDPDCFD